MTETQAKEAPDAAPPLPRLVLLRRVLVWLLAAYMVGSALNYSTSKLNEIAGPAGFIRGMLHGALMPMTLPALLMGNDVTIYAPLNTGRTYKVGYTLGVNACGGIFFGFFFWRISQWRRKGSRR